ncbi:MAG: radical SAM family heme chaperone HemW [Spirochaetes bacterium]|nr:radical SAM family heme chaperone HemW [Spirochaetota bacterium]
MSCGIYIHIPFCRGKCDYCGFYSIPIGGQVDPPAVPGAYVERLLREMEERLSGLPGGETADTVFFGGGTPSLLSPLQIREIAAALNTYIGIERGAEVTLEVNPEDVTEEKLRGFIDSGITRMVLGYQTSREEFHRAIGRSTMRCDPLVLEMFCSARGFSRSVDVMVGLPGQGPVDVKEELALICRYGPEHLSVYCLTLEKNTRLASRFRGGEEFQAGQRLCMEAAMDALVAQGYCHYEISNFALPGCESRHNMKYWTFEPYIGLGPGSHSFYGGKRLSVAMPVDQYIRSDRVAVIVDPRGGNAAAVEYMMTGLRLLRGISATAMERMTGERIGEEMWRRMHELEKEGLLEVQRGGDDAIIRLTREGIFLSDWVIYRIVEDLI